MDMRKKIVEFLVHIRQMLRKIFHQDNEQLPFFIAIFIALIIVVGGINLFIDLTESMHSDGLVTYDSKITEFVTSFRNPNLTPFMQAITHVGDIYGYMVLTVICTISFYLIFKNWRYVLEMIFVLAISGLSNSALKNVINRARPDVDHLVSVATLSYPSGHAMSAISFYGFLIYLIYNIRMKAVFKFGLILLFSTMIFLIGISRIYLGVHFPSDVAAGYIAGFIWVIFCIILFHVIDLLRKRSKKKRMHEAKTS